MRRGSTTNRDGKPIVAKTTIERLQITQVKTTVEWGLALRLKTDCHCRKASHRAIGPEGGGGTALDDRGRNGSRKPHAPEPA